MGRDDVARLRASARSPCSPCSWTAATRRGALKRSCLLTLLESSLALSGLFGIPLARLLTVDGERLPPERVYRKIRPIEQGALSSEEARVKRET